MPPPILESWLCYGKIESIFYLDCGLEQKFVMEEVSFTVWKLAGLIFLMNRACTVIWHMMKIWCLYFPETFGDQHLSSRIWFHRSAQIRDLMELMFSCWYSIQNFELRFISFETTIIDFRGVWALPFTDSDNFWQCLFFHSSPVGPGLHQAKIFYSHLRARQKINFNHQRD